MTRLRFRKLLDGYLSGSSTPDESRLMDEYLERLEAGEEFIGAEDELLKEKIWLQIRSQTLDENVVIKLPWYRRPLFRIAAVAASVMLVIATLSVFLQDKKSVDKNLAKVPAQPVSPISALRHVSNNSGKIMSIQLPDSSLVELEDRSEIAYKEPFVRDRQVMLTGQADFTVTPNKNNPFRVTSDAILTTVSGTRFTVSAKANTEKITVRLYEGAVSIKAVDSSDWRVKKEFYLKPGEEFIYSDKVMARVRRFAERSQAAAMVTEDSSADNPIIPENVSGSWYMFNNQALANVFDQLAFTYEVQIIYEKKDLRNKYFVGRFNKTDSLDVILKHISVANNLVVRREEDKYYITK